MKLQRVQRTFPAFELDIPDLYIGAGNMTFLIGGNGSGKSVWLQALLEESRAPGSEAWPVVGLVRQHADHNLAPSLTLEQNLITRLASRGFGARLWPARFLRGEVGKLLEPHPTLRHQATVRVDRLSMGQRQLLAYLTSSQRDVELLLLDEFLAAADVIVRKQLLASVRRFLAQCDRAAIIVSHDLRLVIDEASRVLVFSGGRLVADVHCDTSPFSEKEMLRLMRVSE